MVKPVDLRSVAHDVNSLVFFEEMARSDDDALAVDHAGDAMRDDELHVRMVEMMVVRRRLGRIHDREGERMEVMFFDRCSETDQVVGAEGRVEGNGVRDFEIAGRQRPRLVEDEGIGLRKSLQRRGALDEDAHLAAVVHGGLEGDGRGGLSAQE